MIYGIVLAGGFSSRAKTNKMILMYKGKELILHTIETMHTVCEKIIVVTGHYHKDLEMLLNDYDYVTIVYNESYELGMFSSIKKGVKRTNGDFFIIPGDYPLVKQETYEELLRLNKDIAVPSYNMKLGHPILFKHIYKEEISKTNLNNLKDFRNSYPFTILETNDPGILMDVDDLNDYNNLIGKD
jgi:molybdenum cofactor cytidylyltransferase